MSHVHKLLQRQHRQDYSACVATMDRVLIIITLSQLALTMDVIIYLQTSSVYEVTRTHRLRQTSRSSANSPLNHTKTASQLHLN